MLDFAQAKLEERNLSHRVKMHLGDVSDLGELASFEAATLIGGWGCICDHISIDLRF